MESYKRLEFTECEREQRVLVAEGGRRGCSRKGKRGNDSGGVVVFREREREEKSLAE